ncbi:basic secretory protein-like protein [Streptomyces olivoreticuli]|uniref:basic secretory protein-like protein n=1 Tax=Streptomyces olivoreticuli TaxID=68246 RepID=UPI000E25C72C|nr:basic secretory protein-like protein [Streptomyces olivoreticuli]
MRIRYSSITMTVLAAATVLTSGLTATAAHAAEPLPESGGTYRISSYAGGALQWDSPNNGAGVRVKDWNENLTEQTWTVTDDGTGNWSIKIPRTNYAVDRDLGNNSVAAWNYISRPNQQWWLKNLSNSRGWLLHNTDRSGGDTCLTRLTDLGTAARPCNAADPAQQWNLDKATAPTPTPNVPVTLQMVNAGGYDPNDLRSWFDRNKGVLQDQYAKIQQFMTGGAYQVKPGINVVYDAGHDSFKNPGVAAVFEPNAKPQYNNEKSIILRPSYVMNNPGDIGSLIHELTHQVQDAANGGWLNEGQADYYRKYVYNLKEKPGLDQIRGTNYNNGYNSTAYMLNYIAHKHPLGESVIQKINNEVRRQGFGADGDRVLTAITGKSGQQWWTDMWNDIQATPTKWTNPAFRD